MKETRIYKCQPARETKVAVALIITFQLTPFGVGDPQTQRPRFRNSEKLDAHQTLKVKLKCLQIVDFSILPDALNFDLLWSAPKPASVAAFNVFIHFQ